MGRPAGWMKQLATAGNGDNRVDDSVLDLYNVGNDAADLGMGRGKVAESVIEAGKLGVQFVAGDDLLMSCHVVDSDGYDLSSLDDFSLSATRHWAAMKIASRSCADAGTDLAENGFKLVDAALMAHALS